MPRRSVFVAGGLMVLAAVIGIYLGVSRSLASPSGLADEAGPIVPALTPVSSAKPLQTPASVMDESEVRRLAREEAQAVLAKAQPKKASSSDADPDTMPDQSDQIAPTIPLAPAKPATPAPQN